MFKRTKRETRVPRPNSKCFSDPRREEPDDAVNFELMSIALSVARLRHLMAVDVPAINCGGHSERTFRRRT